MRVCVLENFGMRSCTASSTTPRRPAGGFTLIEVMITVAVVAILAAIAYPSYLDYMRRGKRATAQTALMDLAARQQSYLLDRRVYTATLPDLGFTAPKEIAGDYQFTVVVNNAATPPTFVATAKPVSPSQTKGGELNLTLDQAGTKAPADYWSK